MTAIDVPRPQGRARRPALPGGGLTLGVTLTALCLVVLLPLAALASRALLTTPAAFVRAAFSARAAHAYLLSFSAAALAAGVNGVFGGVTAWVLVRYRFFGRGALGALVDLPLALPTAVAGVSLAALYGPHGPIGSVLEPLGVKVAYHEAGIVVALIFVGLPFVVRTLEPVVRDLPRELEEAAATLGAHRGAVLARVVFPALAPAWITGVALAFARAVGEYGSVIFIAGNVPGRTEIAPLLITVELEQYDYGAATAVAVVMLLLSLLMLCAINALSAWSRRSG